MEFKFVDEKTRMLLIDILGVEKKCGACGVEITKDNIGAVLPNPTRVSCSDIVCIAHMMG